MQSTCKMFMCLALVYFAVQPTFMTDVQANSDLQKYGDCSDFVSLELEALTKLQCRSKDTFECALKLASEATKDLKRCDRKFTSLAYIGSLTSKSGAIRGEARQAMGLQLIARLIRSLPMVPDPGQRGNVAWSIGISLMETEQYGLGHKIAERLSPWAKSTVLSHGAWVAAMKCDVHTAKMLAEWARAAADQTRTRPKKVLAYSWIARVLFLVEPERASEVMKIAKTSLENISDGQAKEWATTYYAIGLSNIGQDEMARNHLDGISDPYNVAYIKSFSAYGLAQLNLRDRARDWVRSAERELKKIKDNYKLAGLQAILAPAKVIIGEPSGAADIVDHAGRSRAYTRVGNVQFDMISGVLPRSCKS